MAASLPDMAALIAVLLIVQACSQPLMVMVVEFSEIESAIS